MAKAKQKRRAAGEGGLFLRGDGMWVGSVEIPTTDGSRRQKRVYSKDYNKCAEKKRELEDAVRDGVIPNASTTVGRWLTEWLTDIKGPRVRPNTRKFYEEAIRLHITPQIGKKRLDRLTPADVRMMLGAIATSRNKQRAHQTLNLALKAAVKDGMIRRNVCEVVDKPRHLAAERPPFTFDEAQAIIRAAIEIEAERGPGEPAIATRWAAAFLSGARKAELCGLELDRLDLDNGLFDFSWQLQQLTKVHGCGEPVDGVHPCEVNRARRKRAAYCPQARWNFEDGFDYRECYKSLVWTRPKTKTGVRIVPIIDPLLEMVRWHVENDHEPNPHGLVWHWPDGRPISPTDDFELWQQVLRRAGIPDESAATLHSARHSTATMLQAAGVPEEVRMQIMGQSSAAAHRGYVHIDQTQTRAALLNLAPLLALDEHGTDEHD
ncbi:site-specific integrase [Mycobacterium sp. CVI_P3]|uniref:Site-specific integrase n=1 Tax=Mycobacterium pinniadriaticum TaxID=2994102 RepID=A0ABT3SE32_9MYCO|nr:site-specific integrase [Mycobacterium pinniadriaticum]MCX2931342.1 site-specific integrase [Mycobacterium pinniadriaticum]MCX2937766.1 site-specific integrase [Mycobacterium pinniadriaticum]